MDHFKLLAIRVVHVGTYNIHVTNISKIFSLDLVLYCWNISTASLMAVKTFFSTQIQKRWIEKETGKKKWKFNIAKTDDVGKIQTMSSGNHKGTHCQSTCESVPADFIHCLQTEICKVWNDTWALKFISRTFKILVASPNTDTARFAKIQVPSSKESMSE